MATFWTDVYASWRGVYASWTSVAAPATSSGAPLPPSDAEKRFYLGRRQPLLLTMSVVSFSCALWSMTQLLGQHTWLFLLVPYVVFTTLYFVISLVVNVSPGDFSLARHIELCEQWSEASANATVDVLLPTCGEDLQVLANTWNGVRSLVRARPGATAVFVLDDADRFEVAELAEEFGFMYSSRPNRGYFKKAGNLRHGYELSRPLGHEFVVIFDADFRPRADMLADLLPYFFDDPKIGLVQSPQYFDVQPEQTWLQRGAGAVQEFFYRYSQVARDRHDAAICVGTNAVYRRAALDMTGGTALIEHSEDVHTGFDLRLAGWELRYVPLILAKGLCPDNMEAFFKQQYRWCMGSMSLLSSRKFWRAPLRLRQRLCYFTGFCYYIHTALSLFVAPIIPLMLLTVARRDVTLRNYVVLLPAFAYTFIIFPAWHRTEYGPEAWSVKHIYAWAHLMALVDLARRRPMGWRPTGVRGGTSGRYHTFRTAQALLSFLPSLVWAMLASVQTLQGHWQFLPLALSGVFAACTIGRVTCYQQRLAIAQQRYHLLTGEPTVCMAAVRV